MPGEDLPLTEILGDLDAPEAAPAERVVARAFRLRRKDRDAREGVLFAVEAVAENMVPDSPAEARDPLVIAGRALLLYDR